MCGICGYYYFDKGDKPEEGMLTGMLLAMRHRGPDEEGVFCGGSAGLGSARLKIIDLERGKQPIANEDNSLWIVYDGEVFNYPELKKALEAKGHRFRTSSDTEVVLHLYEEKGPDCLPELNGQFAFAIWDKKKEELFIARDRLGIEPLFYAKDRTAFIFASEIKAIFEFPGKEAVIDPKAIDQIFTFWTTVSPRTAFKDVRELRPGHWMRVGRNKSEEKRYWELAFPEDGDYEDKAESYYIEHLRHLVIDATRLRLRADVAIGAYLSGGVDSSSVAAIVEKEAGEKLETLSLKFPDKDYDESRYQRVVTEYLKLKNSSTICAPEDIAGNFAAVMWHAETPVLRTAPAGMYLLSALAKKKGFKAVLSGDGADEFLLGYDIFKEVKLRRFWAEEPDSKKRPLLVKKLYPYLPFLRTGGADYMKKFFSKGLRDVGDPFYSHLLRWETTSRIKRYYSENMKKGLKGYDSVAELRESLPAGFKKWDYMARAQYLEAALFLRNYILSSQGDRMAMAHSVEVRYPYLDHRIVEFASRIPPRVRMRGFSAKALLKKTVGQYLPKEILEREKAPFRTPPVNFFQGDKASNRLSKALSGESVKKAGYFNPDRVKALTDKLGRKKEIRSETDAMALCGIASVSLLNSLFIEQAGRRIFKNRSS